MEIRLNQGAWPELGNNLPLHIRGTYLSEDISLIFLIENIVCNDLVV